MSVFKNTQWTGTSPSVATVFKNSDANVKYPMVPYGTTPKRTYPYETADNSALSKNYSGGGSGLATALSYTAVGGAVAFVGNMVSSLGVEGYKARAKSLGIPDPFLPPAPKPALPFPKPEPTPDNPNPKPEPNLKPAPASDKDTLLSILRQSSDNTGSIAEVIAITNLSIVESIENLTKVVAYGQTISHAYSDANYNDAVEDRKARTAEAQASMLSSAYASEVENAYKEQNLEDMNLLRSSIDNISSALQNLGVTATINRSANEVSLTDKQLQHVTFETSAFQADNLGDNIPSKTPQQMRAIKDAVVAKQNSDMNTFEMSHDDIDDSFFDISSLNLDALFAYIKKSVRIQSVLSGGGI